jgi:predicted amidohydrolase YtcJ
VTGTNLSAETLKEHRLPTRKELDAISTIHPIQLHHVTMHGCVLNSLAMELAEVDSNMRGVGLYDDGTCNGILSDDVVYVEASNRISSSIPASTIKSYITNFTESVLPKGVTTVHSLDAQDLPEEADVWQQLREIIRFMLSTMLNPWTLNGCVNWVIPEWGVASAWMDLEL